MKKIIIVLITILCTSQLMAQDVQEHYRGSQPKPLRQRKRDRTCPKSYLGFSLGANNPAGFVGLDFDLPVAKYVSVSAGAGYSTWGYKLHLDAKYYLDPCHTGWAFGGGLTYNSGLQNFNDVLETVNGNETVVLNLQPQTNLFVAAYHYWQMGRKSRFYIEMGWSVPLVTQKYDEIAGDPLTADADFVVRFLSPGGLMLGTGFSFGLN